MVALIDALDHVLLPNVKFTCDAKRLPPTGGGRFVASGATAS